MTDEEAIAARPRSSNQEQAYRGKTMIPDSIDISSGVSSNLAALIERRVNDPDAEEPVTLGSVRIYLAALLPTVDEAEKLHHFDIDESLLDELDALIEEYGGDVLAIDFVDNAASAGTFPGY